MTTTLEQLAQRVSQLERRIDQLQSTPQANGVNLIVFDKEHDRVLAEINLLRATYASHQTWSDGDLKRMAMLRGRRSALRKILGVQV
jgi:hypothetical protein